MVQCHQELKNSSIIVETGSAIKASRNESCTQYKLSGPGSINGISTVTGGPYACTFGEDMCKHTHAHTPTLHKQVLTAKGHKVELQCVSLSSVCQLRYIPNKIHGIL